MKYTQTEVQNQWLRKILHPKTGLKSLYALVYNCFGIKLHYYQLTTLQGMLDPRIPKLIGSFARQAGKSEIIGVYLAICTMFFNGINSYVFGPKLEQAQISFSRAEAMVHSNKWNLYSGNILDGWDKADRIKFSNNTEIRAVSASLNSEIEGLTVNVIILDEIQNISSFKIKEAILPMGSSTGAKIMMFGVPRTMGTYWHECWKDTSFTRYIYPWDKCLRPKGNLDRSYVMQRKDEDPEIFATQYELRWNEDLSTFIPYEKWLLCELEYKLEEEKGNFWGVDFASKRDSTVITEIKYIPETDEAKIVNWWELQGINYPEQVGFMKDIIHPDIELILCDQSAVGLPVVEFMVEQGLPARGLNFDLHHKDKLYKFMRQRVLQKKVHWPSRNCMENARQLRLYNRFIQQCVDLEIDYKPTGLISVHHPEFNNARDDFCDSLALAIYASNEYVGPSATFWD